MNRGKITKLTLPVAGYVMEEREFTDWLLLAQRRARWLSPRPRSRFLLRASSVSEDEELLLELPLEEEELLELDEDDRERRRDERCCLASRLPLLRPERLLSRPWRRRRLLPRRRSSASASEELEDEEVEEWERRRRSRLPLRGTRRGLLPEAERQCDERELEDLRWCPRSRSRSRLWLLASRRCRRRRSESTLRRRRRPSGRILTVLRPLGLLRLGSSTRMEPSVSRRRSVAPSGTGTSAMGGGSEGLGGDCCGIGIWP